MLSLESIERRLEDPKAYYVFYQFFYKAAVGEGRWKDCMEQSELRIGNDSTEAFALLLFANNYKAWLYDEKIKHGEELMTEYESIGGRSILDVLLLDQEFVLEGEGESLVVRQTTQQAYKKAVKARKDWLAKLRGMSICAEMKESWERIAGDEEAQGNENTPNPADPVYKKTKDRKRRRLVKGMKKWTGQADSGERKFKGWSDSGHKAFVEWTMNIKSDVASGKYKRWEAAFREAQQKQQEARRSEDEPIRKYAVDKDVVWEL
jgi:hypothetical protein